MKPHDTSSSPSSRRAGKNTNEAGKREKGTRQNERQDRGTKRNTAYSATAEPVAESASAAGRPPSMKQGHQEEVQHIDDMLRPLAEREAPPGEGEINSLASVMAEHLLTCEPCQATLSAIIARLTDQAEEGSPERARGAQLLQRFNAVLVKARVRKLLGPYAATLYVHGEEAAREKYPDVADHLEQCKACRQEVAERRETFEAQMAAALHGANAESEPQATDAPQQPDNETVMPGAIVEEP